MQPGGYWRDIDPEIAKAYMKTCWNMTNPGMKQTERCHPLEVRPFSYRENARIQTFPESWKFCGTLSEKYKQIGNAVPCNLAKEIGRSIQETLKELAE